MKTQGGRSLGWAMDDALRHLGMPHDATVLEPGFGIGTFITLAPEGVRFIGVELDSLCGGISRALHPAHDTRIENCRDTPYGQNIHAACAIYGTNRRPTPRKLSSSSRYSNT